MAGVAGSGVTGAVLVLAACAGAGPTPSPNPNPNPNPNPSQTPNPILIPSQSQTPILIPNSTPSPTLIPTTTATTTTTASATPTATAKRYRVVLHAGDSLTGALGIALGKRFEAEGSRYYKDVWVSVSLQVFDAQPRFNDDLRARNPDLVILTLGANNVDDAAPERLAEHVKSIVRKIGSRDCYWIGPATWKEDTGVVDVIAKSCAPCRFFDSRGLKLERKDGIHPTLDGGETWAERFWEFFEGTRTAGAQADSP